MVKMHLLADVNLKAHPELIRLLEEGETIEDLLALSPEKILLRWMNYHLKEAGSKKRVRNFGPDVKDSEAYTIVMNRIAPNKCDTKALDSKDRTTRAKKVLENAKKVGAKPFIKPNDIVSGNEKLNLAFTADLFNACPGLDPLEEEEREAIEKATMMDFEGEREEMAFRMWANSLGIDKFYLNNLFDGLADGLNLLKVIEAVEPGTVSWKKVEKKPKSVFKKNSNNSYAVVLGKSLGLSLVSIGGANITKKDKKLVLGFMWQLMRHHLIAFIKKLSKDGGKVDDKHILNWCNKRVKEAGKKTHISSFKSKNIASGRFLIDLVSTIDPEVVDEDLVTDGEEEKEQLLNARYAISIARKMDCCVFCVPEDIIEVRPKMILSFCASVMSRVLHGGVKGV
eukprot:UN06493